MKLTELQDTWQDDCKINELNLGQESLKTPNLHAKYWTMLSSARLNLRKAESSYLNCRRLKYRYYRGEMTQAELEQEGWDQWQGNKPLKNEMDEFLTVDSDDGGDDEEENDDDSTPSRMPSVPVVPVAVATAAAVEPPKKKIVKKVGA